MCAKLGTYARKLLSRRARDIIHVFASNNLKLVTVRVQLRSNADVKFPQSHLYPFGDSNWIGRRKETKTGNLLTDLE